MINITSEGMLAELQQRIKDKIPSCITRYGDGEAIVLNGFDDMHSLKYVFKRQLGEIPLVEHIEQIKDNLIYAYKESDIIGVPIGKRIHDPESYWYKAMQILINNLGPGIIEQKLLTTTDFHSHFLDKGYFDQLLMGVDTLCYVSCRNLDDAFKNRYGIKNIWPFIIAPEIKFSAPYEGEKHYPDQFNKVRRWVTKVPVQGNICLVGAGVIGKIYCAWLKEQGGIAIDVGSCFDQWAGLVTRGRDRGVNKKDETHKL
jgi:hypothetical protein